jgi:hypothetical protein
MFCFFWFPLTFKLNLKMNIPCIEKDTTLLQWFSRHVITIVVVVHYINLWFINIITYWL